VTATPKILYCHCAYADTVPADVKEAVLDGLGAGGAAFEAVADLCGLAARRDPALARFARVRGLHVVACYPRAVRWLFEYAGAPLGEDATIHNMRRSGAADILARLAPYEQLAPREHTGGNPPPPPAARPTFAETPPDDWVPWFPVIDYARCKNCKQCLEFCLFGAYALGPDGRVRVAAPDLCKLNCPACARVCPSSAIIFPKFPEGGPIAGDDGVLPGVSEDGLKADLARLAKGDVMDLLRRRAARARTAAAKKYPQEPPRP